MFITIGFLRKKIYCFCFKAERKRREEIKNFPSLKVIVISVTDLIGVLSLITSVIGLCFSYDAYLESKKKNDR